MEALKKWGLGYGLDNREAEIQVAMADPNSPLYTDVDSFDDLGLTDAILQGIRVNMKFSKPSAIQAKAFPLILAEPRSNLLAQAQSGTGKTAAFVVGMLSVVDGSNPKTQSLCLAPARELAQQTYGTIASMGEFTGYTMACLVAQDKDKKKKKRRGKAKPGPPIDAQIVVGTPGTVIRCADDGSLNLSDVKMLVLDEADYMIAGNMADNSIRIKDMLPAGVQILMFSATFDDDVWEFAAHTVGKCNTIRLQHKEVRLKKIKQFTVLCDSDDAKFDVICEIYARLSVGQMIIFVDTKATAQDLANKLTAAGHSVSMLTSKLSPSERDAALDDFREARTKVMVATDVLARGIDIQSVNIVVNLSMPTDDVARVMANPATYIHRIGRAGRFGRSGIAINLILKNSTDAKNLQRIESFYGHKTTPLAFDEIPSLGEAFTVDVSENALVALENDDDQGIL